MASASTTTTHKITATIGGSEENALVIDIVYSYPDMEIRSAVAQGDDQINFWTRKFVKEAAEDWLNDEGFFAAKDLAEHERHGDYE